MHSESKIDPISARTHRSGFRRSTCLDLGGIIQRHGLYSFEEHLGLIHTGFQHAWHKPRPLDYGRGRVADDVPHDAARAQLPHSGGPSQMDRFDPASGVAIHPSVLIRYDWDAGCIHRFTNLCGSFTNLCGAPLPLAKEVYRFERDWAHLG